MFSRSSLLAYVLLTLAARPNGALGALYQSADAAYKAIGSELYDYIIVGGTSSSFCCGRKVLTFKFRGRRWGRHG